MKIMACIAVSNLYIHLLYFLITETPIKNRHLTRMMKTMLLNHNANSSSQARRYCDVQ